MIYCVIPKELEDAIFEQLVAHYRDNPNVEVVVERRSGPDRRSGRSYGGQRVTRDRRRARVPGTFLPTDPPD
ncbi:MAG: hypothetical protein IT201_07720 [Thermoleophilia bacterium]|nr:hypothetical protein [Thermoleophilia bacterium]